MLHLASPALRCRSRLTA